jgi:hypothetical protein
MPSVAVPRGRYHHLFIVVAFVVQRLERHDFGRLFRFIDWLLLLVLLLLLLW